MKLTSKTENNGVYQSIEVKRLPAYFKTIAHNIKIISENERVWITNECDIDTSIDAIYTLPALQHEPSTEAEFNEAFEKTMTNINKINQITNGN